MKSFSISLYLMLNAMFRQAQIENLLGNGLTDNLKERHVMTRMKDGRSRRTIERMNEWGLFKNTQSRLHSTSARHTSKPAKERKRGNIKGNREENQQ
jgi:hypothetical protein